jgi:chorismate mutase
MSQLADEKEIDIQELVNEWLRVNIRLIQSIDVGGGKQDCSIVCHIFTWQEGKHQFDHVLLDSISGFTPELA